MLASLPGAVKPKSWGSLYGVATHKSALLPSATPEDDASGQTKLILAITLNVSQFGMVIVSLQGPYPDVPRYCYVYAAANRHCEGRIVRGWQLTNRRWEVTVEAMYAAEERPAEGL